MGGANDLYVKSFSITIDYAAPYAFSASGLEPYILSVSCSVGGKRGSKPFLRDGDAKIVLNNSGGEFFPHNTSSPFYDKLLPRRRVRMYLNGTLFWTGLIETVEPNMDTHNPQAEITLTHGNRELEDKTLEGIVYQDKTVKELVTLVMDGGEYFPVTLEQAAVFDVSELDDATTTLVGDPSSYVNNLLQSTALIPYASDTWETGVTLMGALNDLGMVENYIAFLDTGGSLTVLPNYYGLIGSVADTIYVDTLATGAKFNTNPRPINRVTVSYYPRTTGNGVVITVTEDLTANEEKQFNIKSLKSEESLGILGNVTVSNGNVGVVRWDARSVTVQSSVDVTGGFTISADYVKIASAQTITKEAPQFILKYRGVYEEDFDPKLASTELVAEYIASFRLAEHTKAGIRLESITLVNQAPYEVGDILIINGQHLIEGNKYLITGVNHTLEGRNLSSTYDIYDSGQFSLFIIDSSKIDGEDGIL